MLPGHGESMVWFDLAVTLPVLGKNVSLKKVVMFCKKSRVASGTYLICWNAL